MKKTVCFDFDGVIHSYTSGWQGEAAANDPPVPGIVQAIRDIREAGYKVVVHSTRCKSCQGLLTVNRYLRDNGIQVDGCSAEKPPAVVYIDDRAICFDGDAVGLLEKINTFSPWNTDCK